MITQKESGVVGKLAASFFCRSSKKSVEEAAHEVTADEPELREIHQKPETIGAANLKLCYGGKAGNELPHSVLPFTGG